MQANIGVADATSIWLAQFGGNAVHVIDYVEGVSQPLSYYVNELRSKGYEKARCILPVSYTHLTLPTTPYV